jgi:hypothetical protein
MAWWLGIGLLVFLMSEPRWSGVPSTVSTMADLSIVVQQGLNDESVMTDVHMEMVLFGIMIRSAAGLARSMH